MKIYDPIFGSFELPDYLTGLLFAPEFARLRRISLLNSHSPSVASLGEAKRYSHTLGVIRLALLNPLLGLHEKEIKAFLASLIVHDAGTPAFAHLFEYVLSEEFGWDHESAAGAVLLRQHHPDRHLHQFFEGQPLKYRALCGSLGIDFDLVIDIIKQRHRYSKLIFGTLDFDNLDNVARMAWYLRIPFAVAAIEELARNLSIGESGCLSLPESQAPNVRVWQQLRSAAYNVLVYDGPTVSGQAVLAKVISERVRAGAISEVDWSYDDAAFLGALAASSSEARRTLARDYYAGQPKLLMLHTFRGDIEGSAYAGRNRRTLTNLIEMFLKERLGTKARVYGHVFFDRGIFERKLEFLDSRSGNCWSVGERSASMVLYGFVAGRHRRPSSAEDIGREFQEWMERRRSAQEV